MTAIRAGGCADRTKPWGSPAAAGLEPGRASTTTDAGPAPRNDIEAHHRGRPLLTDEERDALLAPGLYLEAEA